MDDRFVAARVKIKRANQHISDLKAIILSLPQSYTSTTESDGNSINYLCYSPPETAPEIALDMAVIIGDVIHNLRTAIEYSYLGAVQRHAPSILDNYTKFPIGESRQVVEHLLKSRKVDTLSPVLFERIVSDIKPYEIGGNGFIKHLHDLDVSDKHWLLVPVLQVGWIQGIVVENEQGETVRGHAMPADADSPIFIDFRVDHKIKDKGKISIEVIFGEGNPLKGLSVLGTLETFSKVASNIVQVLDASDSV